MEGQGMGTDPHKPTQGHVRDEDSIDTPKRTAPQTARRSTTPKTIEDRTHPLAANLASLPPIDTTQPSRRSSAQRKSYINKRLSTLSTTSHPSRSRPQSVTFPTFPSSLGYTLVRDFAYPKIHPMHYGPPPEPTSAVSTPASELNRRLSDPPLNGWNSNAKLPWSAGAGPLDAANVYGGPPLPATSYGDGPPWSEDEDLHSPIVTSSRHKKSKSNFVDFDYSAPRGQSANVHDRRASFAGMNADGSQLFYVDHEGEELGDGPGGEYITYPPGQDGYTSWHANNLANRSYPSSEPNDESPSPDELDADEDSRYSRDYSFTIASPDEEMHGKAVALFDFIRENENELPLTEGQVLWVSYRHGQGWLVAQDPRSGESGLVPEEYVRLVRDIEGGLNGLKAQLREIDREVSPESNEADTPTAASNPIPGPGPGPSPITNNSANGAHYPPVVSHFSTSSRDLQPYPGHLRESQTSTPVAQIEGPFAGRPEDKSQQQHGKSAGGEIAGT